MKYVYPAVFRKEDIGGYYIFFPDIRMGGTMGNDIADGIMMAEDFLAEALRYLEDEKAEIPMPSDIKSLDLEEGDITTFISADTMEYRRKHEKKAVKKTLTLPSWLNAAAEAAEINFSQTLQKALKEELQIID